VAHRPASRSSGGSEIRERGTITRLYGTGFERNWLAYHRKTHGKSPSQPSARVGSRLSSKRPTCWRPCLYEKQPETRLSGRTYPTIPDGKLHFGWSAPKKFHKGNETMKVQNKVVCLVGSTKSEWKPKYREVLEKLTLMGNAVFTVVWFRGDFDGDFEARRELMEKVHFLKIRTSDVVIIIDKKAIGKHTRIELKYARKIGKPVFFFDELEGRKVT